MTHQYADATEPGSTGSLASWLLPNAAMAAAVVSFALVIGHFVIAASADGDAAREIPSIGSITGASLAIGERPFAYLEFDWEPASGVPGFEPMQEPFRLLADASAG